jgi:hypothetical protein
MRVLLVQSYLGRKGVADPLVFPIGLSCVATALHAAGHEPWIVDLNVGEDPWGRLETAIQERSPEFIGVSQRNIDSTTRKAPYIFHTQLHPTLETIRRVAPGVPVVLGGPGFTQSAATFMERYSFDFGVKSEAEVTLPQLLENLGDPASVPGVFWRDEEGRVHFSGNPELPEFEDLPFPRRDFLDWSAYRQEEKARGLVLDIGVESTRGCPRKCSYCNYPMLNGVKLRRKPPGVVVDEIVSLVETYGVKHFTFTDSRFNLNRNHATEICEELLRRKVQVEWTAWLGFRRVEPEFLGLMKEAGCVRVAFSADGLLNPSLTRMRKEMSFADIWRSVDSVRKTRGLKASWSFFLTPPSTSHKEQLALLGAYFAIQGSMPGRARMMMNWCRVEENTHFEAIAREDGVLPEGIDLFPDTPEGLEPLFYEAPGFAGWSRFWNGFLDAELMARTAAGRLTRPLHRFGLKDLTPPHLRAG